MPRLLTRRLFRLTPTSLAAACLLNAGLWATPALAQSSTPADSQVPAVNVNAPKDRDPRASISGFGNTPAWQTPLQASTYSSEALQAAQVQRLSELSTLDASVSDAYNASGYWDYLSVRGFVLDNTHNYLREGLPISAETSLPLDNKRGVEVFKGTSGIQAGISAPGGLVNLLVKRPEGRLYTGEIAFTGGRSVRTSVDLSDRFGANEAFGLRLNAAQERLNPNTHDDIGHRELLALAADWRVAPGTLIEIEGEYSKRTQPSSPAFSLLGNTLPLASQFDPDANFNARPWSKPVVMRGNTGTVRLQQDLPEQWKLAGIYGEQHLRSDDRAAFPFGCSNDPAGYLADRYCADGSFDLYDYQSDGEVRISKAFDLNLGGPWQSGSIQHHSTVGLMRSLQTIQVPTAVYDYVQSGSVYGVYSDEFRTPFPSPQNNRQEQQTALYVRDALTLSPQWRAWLGLRSTQIQRQQSLSDGSVETSRGSRTVSTPWAALGYEWAPRKQVYVSWGEGIELKFTPFNGPASSKVYRNAASYLPPVKSRQAELGLKAQEGSLFWGVNVFQAIQPVAADVDAGGGLLDYRIDGDARHRGIEAQADWRLHNWALSGSAMVLDAVRRGSSDAGINGKAPVNVPDHTVSLSATYQVPTWSGLKLGAALRHEGPRTVEASTDLRLPAWTRADLSLALTQGLGTHSVTWRLGVVNLFDQRAWRESPTQFGHIYLFPLERRTFLASAQLGF
jgi:iron complex outermembrane receptor protein